MNELEVKFYRKILSIFSNILPNKIAVAVSGGVDSIALLFLLKNSFPNIQIEAITIDHNIRDDSKSEALFTANLCKKHKIKQYILTNNQQIPETNIEANLREIRYNLLTNFCIERNISYLFVGHHKSDIAENFLIRLFRGSGIDGLSTISERIVMNNITLIRPLLEFDKKDLEIYLKEKDIKHIQDPSNFDEKFLRNKIRRFLNEFEDKELITNRISFAANNILENRKIISDLVEEKAPEIYQFNELGYFLINKVNFKNLHQELAFRYLNLMINYFNGNFYKSRLKKIENLYFWITSNEQHLAKNFNGAVIEDFDNDQLIIYREKEQIKKMLVKKGSYIWDNRFKINYDGEEEITIENIKAEEFNKFIKKVNLKNLQRLKNPLKKIFYTLPVIKKSNEIIFFENIYHNKYFCELNNLTFIKVLMPVFKSSMIYNLSSRN